MLNPDKAHQPSTYQSHYENENMDLMDSQLQQELRGIFEVDTQKGLQTYIDQVTRLHAETWFNDIQILYRAIHTIKGGAVTVGADAILQVAIVLEDLLSDLRHLESAPSIEDGWLREALVEAGELLASATDVEVRDDEARAKVQSSVQRIVDLRSQIQQRYLPQWSDERQIQQEFAHQGFELVVLDLEIALENIAHQDVLPDGIIHTARKTLDQLYQIGQDLQLSSGWGHLLRQAEVLIRELDAETWCTQWPRLFEAMKTCAQKGGEAVAFDLPVHNFSSEAREFERLEEERPDLESREDPSIEESVSWDALATVDSAMAVDGDSSLDSSIAFTDIGDFFDGLGDQEGIPNFDQAEADADLQQGWLETDRAGDDDEAADAIADTAATDTNDTPLAPNNLPPVTATTAPEAEEQIQIPIPLEKLDQTAQNLVNTLLSVRSTQGTYQELQAQVLQLASLGQEGAQYITHLRQIQDDYALMDNLKLNLRESGPTPERYREGYIAINRLLEVSLRLSELGAEAEKSAKQMTESLQFLDGSVLKLKDTINESRLVPFRNLAFRARAILRDLTTRFNKPAKLVVHGERTELDVGTARNLEPALLHLIRNAFDHALEFPEARQALGKPEQGTLTLSLQRIGNTYQLDFQDDGCGIDAEKIRDRATNLGLPLQNTSTSADLLAVICQPGFSSESEVSDLSGRGVGMDVVAAQISRLGGKLTLDTNLGTGTTFRLQFPVPHLLVPCILLQAGEYAFAIPAEDIKTVALLESLQATAVKEADTVYSWQVNMGDAVVPGLDLLEYWRPRLGDRLLEETAVCTYVQSPSEPQGVWLIADELLGQSDLLINSLPSPLLSPAGLMGISLQPDGTLVPVIDASAIVDWLHSVPQDFISELSGLSELNFEDTIVDTPTILIVDDAALMRRRLAASLTAYGHDIHTCGDGLEAWNWLKLNPKPALIITDIEMPNMDGFTLINRCRQEGMTMPILVVSSRLSEDWFDEAQRLGANDYLTKGFSTLELMNKTEELLSSASPGILNKINV
ncbi:response regulator [Oscillatoria sp. CS-180]|uniref:ATP-binding response regulator n=1 Tax=Oscillatoria sp. CS-180 TaxID=3021720 RepID=UPI00232C0373|nr:response regulator [Oscillatoria sp. CS-180]MDB9525284.1 response regulator [Oscillatoria sp. CS-180]